MAGVGSDRSLNLDHVGHRERWRKLDQAAAVVQHAAAPVAQVGGIRLRGEQLALAPGAETHPDDGGGVDVLDRARGQRLAVPHSGKRSEHEERQRNHPWQAHKDSRVMDAAKLGETRQESDKRKGQRKARVV